MMYGLFVAVVSSAVGALYLNAYYTEMFDYSMILPIWKVVSIYTALSLFLSLVLFFVFKYLGRIGVLVLNTLFVMAMTASIYYPITYFNNKIDVEYIAVAALPIHFIMPLVWLAIQPFALISKS